MMEIGIVCCSWFDSDYDIALRSDSGRTGWKVVSATSEQQRSGCLRIIMLGGIGALIWKPKPHLVVTYEQ